MGYRDIHSHYLYGLDDGTKTKQEMEAMLDAAQADDISSLFATPHVIPGVRFFDFSAYANASTKPWTIVSSRAIQ